MPHPRPYYPNLYRIVKVTLTDRIYRTVQLDEGSPWGPKGAVIEVEHGGLALSQAEALRDYLNNFNSLVPP